MYIEEAVIPLVASLEVLCHQETVILMAYGRNRPAEASFLSRAAKAFDITELASKDLDGKYQCSDVKVLRLQKHGQAAE